MQIRRPPTSIVGALLAGLCVAALLAGCGSSYSRKDYVAQADGICTNTLHALRSLPASGGGTAAGLATYLARVVPLEQAQARALMRLRRPPETRPQRAATDAYLSAARATVTGLEALEHAAQSGDAGAVAAAEQSLAAANAPALAAAAGLTACGTAGATIGRG